MSLQHRQGDLLFVLQETRPKVTLLVRPGLVILTGETTGHSHRLTAGQILEDPEGTTIYLDLPATARVVHEEHDSITLGPGLWLVVRQREYGPSSNYMVYD